MLEQAYRRQLAFHRIQSINRDVVITRRANLRRLSQHPFAGRLQVVARHPPGGDGIVRSHPLDPAGPER